MYSRLVVLSVAVGLSLLITSTVLAQCGCSSTQVTYSPVEPSYTTNYAPTVMHNPPAPYVTYNMPARPQAAYYTPVSQAYTTRYALVAQPCAAYYVAQGWSIYRTPKVYVPGEPVRNVLRAITP